MNTSENVSNVYEFEDTAVEFNGETLDVKLFDPSHPEDDAPQHVLALSPADARELIAQMMEALQIPVPVTISQNYPNSRKETPTT